MATLVIMPKVGMSVESCIITKWHKKKGDTVKLGDLLFSYETDKASVDEEAKQDGVVLEILADEGDDVPVLQNVCIIGEQGEDISSLLGSSQEQAEEKAPSPQEEKPAQQQTIAPVAVPVVTINTDDNVKVSPRAKSVALKGGVDLRTVAPSGPEGRIIERDVRAALQGQATYTKAATEIVTEPIMASGTGIGGKVTVSDVVSAPASPVTTFAPQPTMQVSTAPTAANGEYEQVKLTNIRKFIAKSMQSSLNNMAQLTLNASFDATSMLNYRKTLKNGGETLGIGNITLNDMILFAVAKTLKSHRDLNAHLVDDSILYFNSVNLGIAVDTDRGLMVPTLFGADKMSLSQLSVSAKQIITDSQKGTIAPDLLKGATFTITNLGTLDVESFTPVINPPQTGILGVCTIVDKVKEVDGKLTVYPSMGLSLTFDHRALDGAPAARFLKDLKKNLENFSVLMAI